MKGFLDYGAAERTYAVGTPPTAIAAALALKLLGNSLPAVNLVARVAEAPNEETPK